MNSNFTSQFSYSPLFGCSMRSTISNKINSFHKICFRMTCNDKTSSFEELLEKEWPVSIHTRNLQILVREVFKVYKKTIHLLLFVKFLKKICFQFHM